MLLLMQSCPWVGLTHLLGWVHYSKSTKIWKDYINAFKARSDIRFGCTKQLNSILRPIWQVPETDQKEHDGERPPVWKHYDLTLIG